jgi:hypothetical protein
MFELYARNIDPDDTEFQTFIKRFVSLKEKRDPGSIPYSELYKTIREGIREYLKKTEETKRSVKK